MIAINNFDKLIKDKDYEVLEIFCGAVHVRIDDTETGWYTIKRFKEVSNESGNFSKKDSSENVACSYSGNSLVNTNV